MTNKRQQNEELSILRAELAAANNTVAAYSQIYPAGAGSLGHPTDMIDADDLTERWNAAHDRVTALEGLIRQVERAASAANYRLTVPQATRDLVAQNID